MTLKSHYPPQRKMLTPIAAARMQQALTNAPQSIEDLATISGLGMPVVRNYVRQLYEANVKMVYVADWGKDPRGYPTIRKYQWGNKPDVVKTLKWKDEADRMYAKRTGVVR